MIILNENQIVKIINKLITTNEIDDSQNYIEFLSDIGEVLTNHCGGDVLEIKHSRKFDSYIIKINENDSIPDDGGIYKDFIKKEDLNQKDFFDILDKKDFSKE